MLAPSYIRTVYVERKIFMKKFFKFLGGLFAVVAGLFGIVALLEKFRGKTCCDEYLDCEENDE